MQTPPDRKRRLYRALDAFFLPMHDPDLNHTNPTLWDYLHWNILEEAPVSSGARDFVLDLQTLGIAPNDWRDRHSRPLLEAAAQWNYVALFKWLVERGCEVRGGLGKRLLMHAEAARYDRLAEYIRSLLP